MTLEKANKIFRTKYPNGEIAPKQEQWLVGHGTKRYLVAFEIKPDHKELLRPWDENCTKTINVNETKWYAYQCSSYEELLHKLGFENFLYKCEIETLREHIAELKNKIETGKYFHPVFGGCEYPREQIEDMKKELKKCEDLLANVIEI